MVLEQDSMITSKMHYDLIKIQLNQLELQLQNDKRQKVLGKGAFKKNLMSEVIQCFIFQLNDLQRAIPCAYTYLQKNPEDQEMHQLMEEYKSQYDLSGYLTDHEEQPYEVRTRSLINHFLYNIHSIIES